MNTIEGLTIRWEPWTVAAMLSHLWQSSVVGLMILILMFAARRASARTRWMIGWIGLIKFTLPLIWFNPTVSRLKFPSMDRSEEHTSELQSPCNLVCRLLLD